MFHKVYILSLRKDKERRKKLLDRISGININFEIFDAIPGEILEPLYNRLEGSQITNAKYLAATLSHLAIYNDAISNGYDRILILEDDAIPHRDFNALIEIVKHQSISYDLLYLGWIPLSDDMSVWDYNIINDRFVSSSVFLAKNLWGLYAYSISSSLMKRALEFYSLDIPMELDRYFVTKVQPLGSFGVVPQLFCHDSVYSNNNGYGEESIIIRSIDTRFSNINDYLR